jgi:ureidoacrylate peracid hydrolase
MFPEHEPGATGGGKRSGEPKVAAAYGRHRDHCKCFDGVIGQARNHVRLGKFDESRPEMRLRKRIFDSIDELASRSPAFCVRKWRKVRAVSDAHWDWSLLPALDVRHLNLTTGAGCNMPRVTPPQNIRASREVSSKAQQWFRSFEPIKTALLIVDMQNHWVDERGASYTPKAKTIVPNINRLASAIRAKQGTIVWIQSTMSSSGPGAWSLFFDHLTENGSVERAELMPGHAMHELWAGLDVRPTDCRASKNRFSAFIQGASNVEELLRVDRQVDTVLIAGVATNICCESTARDAMMRDFRTVMIDDANAARSKADHLAGLRTFKQVFGAVMNTDEAIARLSGP